MRDKIQLRKFSFLIFVFFLVGCSTLNPATGRKEFIFIDTETEVAMGKDIHKQILQQYKISSNLEQVAHVEKIGQKLAQVSDRKDYEYHFYVINNDELNAFTVPGGSIYIFTGLLEKLSSDDEIAAVLAHEIGHGAARHTVKKFQAAMGYNLVGTIVLSQVAPAQQQLAAMSSSAVMQLVFSAYGRRDEYQADQLGLRYLYRSGYDLKAMIKTFKVLKVNSKGPEVPLILRSHPYLEDRIAAVETEIQDIEDGKSSQVTAVTQPQQ
ncbi:MAG: M48 family metallopeptidase [Candidatus Omnitrophica bacterium]|nr:M48 family metallopeptidase [Candidatus Omnitrophota bacterium]